jgi:hypothetical protein
MSDAVNCLVYVSSPMDGNRREDTKEVFKEIDLASKLLELIEVKLMPLNIINGKMLSAALFVPSVITIIWFIFSL